MMTAYPSDLPLSITAETFDEWVRLPEHAEKNWELIGGEVFEVVSASPASQLAMLIGGIIAVYLLDHPIAHITGADGGYMVAGERYIPDVGITLKVHHPELAPTGYNPFPPDLAIEVVSPSDYQPERVANLQVKLGNYLASGTVVWIIYPESSTLMVYVPNQAVKKLGIEDTLDGGTVLPDLKLSLKRIFQYAKEQNLS